MTFADVDLGFDIDEAGNRSLKGGSFVSKIFSTLELDTDQPDQEILIEDCEFIKCKIDPGRFVFWRGVVLRNVLFDNIKHGGEIIIHSNTCILDRVTFKRKPKTSLLWIKPRVLDIADEEFYRDWIAQRENDTDVMLDISDFNGNVEIYGLPVDRVVTNADNHAKLRLSEASRNWEREGIMTSFWKMTLDDIANNSKTGGISPTAIVQLPLPNDHEYDAAMAELDILKRLDILVA